MNRMLPSWSFAAAIAVLAPLPAQEQEAGPVYRDLSLVLRLRVTCEQQHFGRLVDLVAEVPSGRIAGAVVTMAVGDESRAVLVPYGELRFDARTNLLQLGTCLLHEAKYPPFDPATVKVTAVDGDGDPAMATGTVLLSRLQHGPVALQSDPGSAQGLTVELTSGHIAFVDLAAGTERAGDAELHPTPWSALRVLLRRTADGAAQVALALGRTAPELRAAPNLVEIIVQNPLYRARVYKWFGVPRPDFDRS